jgi:hypothetical protein
MRSVTSEGLHGWNYPFAMERNSRHEMGLLAQKLPLYFTRREPIERIIIVLAVLRFVGHIRATPCREKSPGLPRISLRFGLQ